MIAAAGAGLRAGGPKAVRIGDDDPRTFLDRAVAALRAWGCDPVVTVVRPEHEDFARRVGAEAIVPNPAPEAMIDSLRAGIAQLLPKAEIDAVVFAPVDCPKALEAFARFGPKASDLDGSRPLVGGHQGRPGHPVILSRTLWGRLELPAVGLEGARAVLADAVIVEVGPESLENRNT